MITQTDQIRRIEETFDAAKEICKVLAPMSERGRRRLLSYFCDLVSDPETDAGMKEADILKQVHAMLNFELPPTNNQRNHEQTS